ncbi:MAG: hypothetical protein ACLQPD_17055, partial [Desulfomonilaceae bacterium]
GLPSEGWATRPVCPRLSPIPRVIFVIGTIKPVSRLGELEVEYVSILITRKHFYEPISPVEGMGLTRRSYIHSQRVHGTATGLPANARQDYASEP